ncbi:MAG: large-conductance mechanosensitive channel protein MscL [Muribaculaceae bacterium]|nr:large-conductance mechanosensitive channel protein MscL [Muribaculaceae bacterium]
MSNFIQDFKQFAMRGNVLDMAVGVIMGGAFGKIVTSLVNDVIMPLVGKIMGGFNFTELKWVLSPATTDAAGNEVPEVALAYGNFIQSTVDFVIIAFCIFCFISLIAKLQRKKDEEPAAPAPAPEPSKEEAILSEIRDLLIAQQQNNQ